MRIGITGASGFLGGHLACLLSPQSEIIAYTRGARHRLRHAPHESYQLPAATPQALPETRLDALVHLAGESLMGLWTAEKKARIWQSRVDFTEGLVAHLGNWKKEHLPKVLICASGAGFYGDAGDALRDETSPQGTGFLAEICGRWEAAAQRAEALGIRVVMLRTGMVLGRDGGAYPLLKRVFALGLGGRLGSGAQWMPWIHLHDAVGLIRFALVNDSLYGPLNLCAPEAVTNAEFTRTLAAALKRPAFFHAPAFAMRLLLRDMASEMLLGSQRVTPQRAVEAGYAFEFPTLKKALSSLV